MGGGAGMGGRGGGGRLQMLRMYQKTFRTAGTVGGSQETLHCTNTTGSSVRKTNNSSGYRRATIPTNKLSLSSTNPTTPTNPPISAAPAWPICSSPTYTEDSELELECIDGSDDDRTHALLDDFVFGSVPTVDEVQHAVHSIQEFIEPASFPYPYVMKDGHTLDKDGHTLDKDTADKESSPTGFLHQNSWYGTKLDWIEPPPHLCNPNALQPYRSGIVLDAFHLLQREPSVQRMVVPLSSDRAVWEAVLNNEVVREIRDSLNQEDNISSVGSDDISVASDSSEDILSWIVNNVKAKIVELINNISKAVNELCSHQRSDMAAERNAVALEEKLKTTFMLSVVVLLIVVLNRANKV